MLESNAPVLEQADSNESEITSGVALLPLCAMERIVGGAGLGTGAFQFNAVAYDLDRVVQYNSGGCTVCHMAYSLD
jgi:hypothetical protein